ncbi:DNA polymerase III subunit epsilon [Bacteroidia bacterium]|nr:DNA polymerase III subunit epsilon [Bacteroidia bacterium]
MKDFAAIDFETANGERSSICSIGLVIVRDGQITDRICTLVCPEPNYYTWFCTSVHGITFRDTEDAPIFPVAWARIAPKIEGLPLVAHNCAFDAGCLKAVHKTYQMDYPDYIFHCTLRTSRKVFGKCLPNHRLPTVAAHCGYDLRCHHHALADAEACAHIALAIL